jgi:hypothetical protein
MTDPVLCIVIYAVFLAAMAAAHFFKTLDNDLGTAWRTAFAAGLVIAVLLFVVRALYPAVGSIALTLAALYVRHTGRETEAVDGMIVGSVMGATAAVPFVLTSIHAASLIAALMLAGGVAGYGITFAVFHVADKRRQVAFDIATAVIAIIVAWLPSLAVRYGIREHDILLTVAAAMPLIVIVVPSSVTNRRSAFSATATYARPPTPCSASAAAAGRTAARIESSCASPIASHCESAICAIAPGTKRASTSSKSSNCGCKSRK